MRGTAATSYDDCVSCDDNALLGATAGGWSKQLPCCGVWYTTDASGATAAAAAADVSAGCMLMTTVSDDDVAAAAAAPVSVDVVHSKTLPTSASVSELDTLLLHDQAGDSTQLEQQLRAVQAQLMAVNQQLLHLHQKQEASSALQHQYSGGHAEAHPLHAPALRDPFVAKRAATPGGLLLPRNNSSSGSLAAAHFSAPNTPYGGDSALHAATTPLPGCWTWQALPAAAAPATATRARRKSVRLDDPGAAAAADEWCAAAATAAKSVPIAGCLGELGMPAMWQELLLEDLGAEKSSCENITSTDLLLPLTGCHSEPAMARATTPGGGVPPAARTASDGSAAARAHTCAWLKLQQPQQQQQQIMQQLAQHTQQLQNLSLAPAGALPGVPDAMATGPTYTLSPASCTAVAAVASPPAAVPAGRQHSSGASGGVAPTFTAAPAVPAAHDAAVSGAPVSHQHSAEAADVSMAEFEGEVKCGKTAAACRLGAWVQTSCSDGPDTCRGCCCCCLLLSVACCLLPPPRLSGDCTAGGRGCCAQQRRHGPPPQSLNNAPLQRCICSILTDGYAAFCWATNSPNPPPCL
jgi:hypothetical protein